MISKISIYRKQIGMSQKELAQKCNCSVGTIVMAENNIIKSKMDLLKKIADVLNKDIKDLFD